MKGILENLISKIKSPSFRFDEAITNSQLLGLIWNRMSMYLRGIKVYLFFPVEGRIFIGKHVKLSGKCSFGKSVTIDDYSKVSGLCRNQVLLKDNVNIGRFSSVIASTSYNYIGEGITIEANVAIGEYAYLGGAGGLKIGQDTIIGQYFSCHPENHHFTESNKLIRLQGVSRKGIEIGRNSWIGSKVTFLDGSCIGDNCVVAAGAVVTQKFGNSVLIGGVPARVIKNI
jgi:acetyltransferase-like isoleucine patch superfamily enzyme